MRPPQTPNIFFCMYTLESVYLPMLMVIPSPLLIIREFSYPKELSLQPISLCPEAVFWSHVSFLHFTAIQTFRKMKHIFHWLPLKEINSPDFPRVPYRHSFQIHQHLSVLLQNIKVWPLPQHKTHMKRLMHNSSLPAHILVNNHSFTCCIILVYYQLKVFLLKFNTTTLEVA